MYIFSSYLTIALTTLVALQILPYSHGSAYVISDDRVRSLDVTPVLGRGYSIMTNTYQSTCLNFNTTTIPSYNYDYTYHEFSQDTTMATSMASSLSYSFGYSWVKVNVAQKYEDSTTETSNTHHIISVMRIERYYSSIREETSFLNEDAAELINRQDYVGFFKACGPNYIRGLRRAQEVTGVFSFESSSKETASQYSRSVQVAYPHWGNFQYGSRQTSNSKFNSINSSLKISILGYGLGLSEDGSSSLVASSLVEFQDAMKFAFNAMTKSPGATENGMVYGMEVTPWVYNVAWQVASGLQDEAIEVPMARSLIQRAYRISDPTDFEFDNNDRTAFRCKAPFHEIDRFGYCCEIGALYDIDNEVYDSNTPEERYCRPLRQLEKAVVGENAAANGEFVARLDSMLRTKMIRLSTLERCISAARAIPERFDYHVLKSMDTVGYDKNLDVAFTALELKMALDPFNDFSMVTFISQEIDEWIEMFYQPCMNALFGANIGSSSETDPNYFVAYPWHTHKECSYLSCFTNGMRWDRSGGGGCVPGLITGSVAVGYNDGDDFCAKDGDSDSDSELCKYSSGPVDEFFTKTSTCWEQALPAGRIDYFMDHFCMPTVTDKKLTDEEANELMATVTSSCRLDCVVVTFTTLNDEDHTGSRNGYFEIMGYGRLPKKCHETSTSTCDIQLCDMDTMEIRARTTDAWKFEITGAVGDQIDFRTSTGGTSHPNWMDTDEYDNMKKFELNRQVVN